jgi:hypothetical protein
LDVDANQGEKACVGLLVDEGEVVEELFWDGEVEEDVEAAHGEIIEESKEVDGEGEGGSYCGCGVGDVCSEGEGVIDEIVD